MIIDVTYTLNNVA